MESTGIEKIEQRSNEMYISNMSKRKFSVFAVAFFILFGASLVATILGPSDWNYHSMEYVPMRQYSVHDMDPAHQDMRLTLSVSNPKDKNVDTDLEITMRLRAECTLDKDCVTIIDDVISYGLKCGDKAIAPDHHCQNITLFHLPYIEYESYVFSVMIADESKLPQDADVFVTVQVVPSKFTMFELWFRFVFLCASFVISIVFSFKLRLLSWSQWSLEQKWVSVLLFWVMAYDNPFFAFSLITSHWFPLFLDQLLAVTFIAILLLFWLVIFDGMRRKRSARSFLVFYLPKLFYLFIFYVATIVAFTYIQLHRVDDPTFDETNEKTGYLVARVVMIFFAISYTGWLLYAIVKSATEVAQLGSRLKFLGLQTSFVILLTVFGIIFKFLGPQTAAVGFLSYLALFNLYVYTLAIFYLPAGYVQDGMIRLEDDEEAYEMEEIDENTDDEIRVDDDDLEDGDDFATSVLGGEDMLDIDLDD